MKTHILSLEPHDDFTSVRDKMAWGKAGRILLVWPEKDGRILHRRLDLVLLKRRAAELGAQLACVSGDPDVRFHARQLEIPVFRSTAEAQSSRWVQRRREAVDLPAEAQAPRPDLRGLQPGGRAPSSPNAFARLAALAGSLAAVLALAGAVLPGAHISLQPAVETQAVQFTAFTGPTISALNVSGAIPARVHTVIVEGRQSVETTGSVRVPAEFASGWVEVTNLVGLPVRIEAGTVVRTGGEAPVRYAVTEGGDLPGEAGAVISLPVTALAPGTGSNRSAGAVTSVEGTLGLQVTVTNPAPLTGGSDATLAAPTTLDRSRAANALLDALRTTAADELAAQIDPTDVQLSTTPFLSATLEETYLPTEDTPADFVEVTLRLEFQMLTLARADLMQLGRLVLDAALEPGYSPLDEEISLEFLEAIAADSEGAASWSMQAARQVRADVDTAALAAALTGRTRQAAVEQIERSVPLAAPPRIEFTPAWWPRLPLLPVQIEISAEP